MEFPQIWSHWTQLSILDKLVSLSSSCETSSTRFVFFFKWPILGLFFVYFRLYKQILQFLQQIYVKKCYVHQVCGARSQTHHNLQHTCPPITTRPGLPPDMVCLHGKVISKRPISGISFCVVFSVPSSRPISGLSFCRLLSEIFKRSQINHRWSYFKGSLLLKEAITVAQEQRLFGTLLTKSIGL